MMPSRKAEEDMAFILNDLQENGPQSSWDWVADLRFAKYVGEPKAIELFTWAIDSTLVVPVLIDTVMRDGEKTKARRLRALRMLVHNRTVEAVWSGMGDMGVHDFGVNRVRTYRLAKEEEQKHG